MKYFTRGWTAGEHDDEAVEQMRSAYWKRIQVLRPLMPEPIVELSTDTVLHDGLIDYVRWDCSRRSLELKLVCVDPPSGCFELRLLYSDVQMSGQSIELLAERARDRRTVVLFDEIDRDHDGAWIHRILFWPVGETSICFQSLTLSRASRADRRWDHVGCDPFVRIE